MALATVVDKLKAFLSPREALVKDLGALVAAQAADAGARQVALDEAQAAVDALDKPRRDLARLQAEAIGASARESIALGALEHQLRETPSAAAVRFTKFVERIYARARVTRPPAAEETIHRITGERTILNLDAIEWYLAAVNGPRDPERPGAHLPSALGQAWHAAHHELWRLSDAEQRARIAELRRALEASFAGTALEAEIG